MLVDETVKAPRIEWRFGEVVAVVVETPAVKSLVLSVPGWPGHRPGQHVDVRLTAEDGYQAQRSYSIASAPEQGVPEQGDSGVRAPDETKAALVILTVERLADGEVSPFLTDEVRVGDRLEVRGPIGGYFTWSVADGGPLFLVAGGSGIVPLMAMLRHRAVASAAAGAVPAVLLYSSRSFADVIYRGELAQLAGAGNGLQVVHTLTRSAPPDWTGYARRIDRAMLAEVAPEPALRPLVYVCGPTPLVEFVANTLVELGHDPLRIKTERFGPTG